MSNILELIIINGKILLVTISFFVLAIGLKLIDEAYDGLTFNKRVANLIAPFIVLLAILIMTLDRVATVILIAYLISITIQKKVDLTIYKISLLIFIILFLGLSLYNNLVSYLPILIVYILLTFLDEQGNKIADHYFLYKDTKISPYFALFMKFRFFILTGTILLSLLGQLSYLYIAPVLAWGIGYNGVIILSENRKKSKSKQLTIVRTMARS